MSLAHDAFIEWQKQRNAAAVHLDLQSTALVIIDMQEWATNPVSAFCRYGERRMPGLRDYFLAQVERVVIPNLRHLLDFFRVHRLRVIHTTIASELPDGRDWIPTLRRTNAVAREEIGEVVFPARTDPWARIVDALTPRPDEVVINKTTYSAFTSTGLDCLLRNLHIETLVLGGIITNRCVETTARDATDRGYRVILLEDASATYSPELQEATMLSLQGSYGYVRRTNEVLALLEQALPVGTVHT
jgi:nicotinamidase-related amidase